MNMDIYEKINVLNFVYNRETIQDAPSYSQIVKDEYTILYKEFFDEEFQIVDVTEDRNGNGVLVVWDRVAGTHFDVCYGDFEERKCQLHNPEEYKGKALTVKYQTRYKDSKLPQFPTGLRIRNGYWEDGKFIPTE